MQSFTDQTGNTIHFSKGPQRIVSLVPSQTELLCDLGLEKEVLGITKFCVHPGKWFKSKCRVGGTKTVNIAAVQQLKPDLIIANKEENEKEHIETLMKSVPVWVSDIHNLTTALDMIKAIGMICNKGNRALEIIEQVQELFFELPIISRPLRSAYLIWKSPYMAVGSGTFINDMMKRCGLTNIFEDKQRYPETNVDQLSVLSCELLLLSSEPYPFKQKHINELKTLLPHTRIMLADGEMFSWYGSRLLKAGGYFRKLMNEIH